MTALQKILDQYRQAAQTEREKGTYFEELILCYFQNESIYKRRFAQVWLFADWAREEGISAQDTGIDLVALSYDGEYFAIQCKLYAEDYKLQKRDIDSFFTASGKKPFRHRIIVSTTNNWSQHAEDAISGQQIPVNRIDLQTLENSQIDWSTYSPKATPAIRARKTLRPHQVEAFDAVTEHFSDVDRGKLIMACGTGKTFTSLKIAEHMAGEKGQVLFLVPSLALLSQSLTEWTQESSIPLTSFAVCSDSDVGKKRSKEDDRVQTYLHELFYPATTNAETLAMQVKRSESTENMTVIFATYHSIETVSQAQKNFGLKKFDLIICDEAHRTTGAKFDDEDESHFTKVHGADFIQADKRLYMTATPRIYGNATKAKAEQESIVLCSMDDPVIYGETLHTISFSEAVAQGLLVDYKVIVLSIEESHVSRRIQKLLKDENNQLKVDDATKIIGCWKALSKQWPQHELMDDHQPFDEDSTPMQRAVAFCQVIEASYKGKKHKVSSKQIASMFSEVVEAYRKTELEDGNTSIPVLRCEAEHVDGSMNASQKEEKLNWLKAPVPEDTCRVLSNVRCLSEGVDVPALDAVLFLTPRNSQVEVVQSVGRVMRNAPGKKLGYVILPVVIPAGMEADEALNTNEVYRVVWEVLQALRSHDDRFDAMINKLDLIGNRPRQMEVIAISDTLPQKRQSTGNDERGPGRGTGGIGSPVLPMTREGTLPIVYQVDDIDRAIYAKIVKKCGNPLHWEQWAKDIAKIANTHIDRITGILENPKNIRERETFAAFAKELRDDLNDSLSDAEIVEMLAQHLITKPVFDALFSGYDFAGHNPISIAMQGILEALQEHHLDKETDTLQKFYESVKVRAEGITTTHGRQRIILELYDKFFSNAFPKVREKLGIVYTPVEVVDFIIHSVNDILKKEFNLTLGSDGVHILDPFTGTGTFITRLLQSGLLTPEEIAKKYKGQMHANELVLLAYYIAAINIESVYHGIAGGDYVPFEGICLTDTFQMTEKDDLIDIILEDNSERRKRQMELDIRVIIGNPPYSIGQKNEDDNNKNISYPKLDEKIRATYAAKTSATLSKGLYDSYIRAIRWASDRIKDYGIIGFVCGSAWLERQFADGMRKCLAEEFTNIYVLHLRGDIRKNMLSKGRAGEGQNIFGQSSMTGIAIVLFVKNPQAKIHGQINFHDIGNNLTREEKLDIIEDYNSIEGITKNEGWQSIIPDEHGDWLSQRDDNFGDYIVLGDKKNKNGLYIFNNYSLGVATNRDAWCYNSSKASLIKQMGTMIRFYNNEQERLAGLVLNEDYENKIATDSYKISWTYNLKHSFFKGQKILFSTNSIISSTYRPFTPQWLYYNRLLNERVYQMPNIFPHAGIENLVICVSGVGARSGFSTLISDKLPCLDCIEKGQCFPLYLYEERTPSPQNRAIEGSLFDTPKEELGGKEGGERYVRKDGITDKGLRHFQEAYPTERISKEDVFYYMYGMLHSPCYREKYADNLSKELPRIPRVQKTEDFWHFSRAGRELGKLHLHYETVEPYPATITGLPDEGTTVDAAYYRVEKMRYGKGKGKGLDKSIMHYNTTITVSDIPLEAYDYRVNGKPALDWIVERQCVKTDKASGIVNDANDWAIETMHNPKYPLELFLRVITVSLQTLEIVKKLPKLNFDELT